MARTAILAFAVSLTITLPTFGRTINHADVDGVASLPQSTMDAVGLQKWLFTHASVGGNMVDGMNDLHAASPTRYKLIVASVGFNGSLNRANNPPSPTANGTVYECNRGNPGWQAKVTIFDNSVRLGGWQSPAVNVAMDKFCYIDQTANATTYLNSMAALEASFPTTVYVYMTMPLMNTADSDNILRNQFNTAVRAYCTSNNRLLFDIADIEAYDPSGVQYTFTSGGTTYQKLYNGYTSDGGHLNTTGRQRVATGWYAVAAAIVSAPVHADYDRDGDVDLQDFAHFRSCFNGPNRTPPTGCGDMDFDTDNDVDLDDFTTFRNCFNGPNRPPNC